jgi:hypothetical protein
LVRGPAVHVHIGVEDEFRPARKAHPAFIVANLAAFIDRLAAAGIQVVIDDADIGVSRCYAADPFDNRIELVAAADAGFTERSRQSRLSVEASRRRVGDETVGRRCGSVPSGQVGVR